MIAKFISIKGLGCRSSRCAGESFKLSWGGLQRCSRIGTGDQIAVQRLAEGIAGRVVGEASEALQCRKAEQQLGRAGTMVDGPNDQ